MICNGTHYHLHVGHCTHSIFHSENRPQSDPIRYFRVWPVAYLFYSRHRAINPRFFIVFAFSADCELKPDPPEG